MSRLGSENPLPQFSWQRRIPPLVPSVGLNDAEVERSIRPRTSVLPYLMQDDYDHAQEDGRTKFALPEFNCYALAVVGESLAAGRSRTRRSQ